MSNNKNKLALAGTVLFVLLATTFIPTFASADNAHRVVGYYPSWATYDRNYQIKNIPGHLLTHLNYAFANVDANGNCIFGDEWADVKKQFSDDPPDAPYHGNLRQLQVFKRAYPHIKTLISVGGWTYSAQFSDVAADPSKIQNFVNSCTSFMAQYGFDGIDIDWEFPVVGGIDGMKHRPEDAANYVSLLAALRNRVGTSKLITIAAPPGFTNYEVLDISGIAANVDWVNVMSYDFHGTWEAATGHNAPMAINTLDPNVNRDKLTIKAVAAAYLKAGLTKNQLVLGVPFAGRGWGGVGSTNNGLFQSSSYIPSGTWENGMFDYSDLKANYIGQNGYVRYWDEQSQAAYLYSASKGVFISFDDDQSMRVKSQYIKETQLGGAMIWDLSSDKGADLLTILVSGLSDWTNSAPAQFVSAQDDDNSSDDDNSDDDNSDDDNSDDDNNDGDSDGDNDNANNSNDNTLVLTSETDGDTTALPQETSIFNSGFPMKRRQVAVQQETTITTTTSNSGFPMKRRHVDSEDEKDGEHENHSHSTEPSNDNVVIVVGVIAGVAILAVSVIAVIFIRRNEHQQLPYTTIPDF